MGRALTFDPVAAVEGDLTIDQGLVRPDDDEEPAGHRAVELPLGLQVLVGGQCVPGARREGWPEGGGERASVRGRGRVGCTPGHSPHTPHCERSPWSSTSGRGRGRGTAQGWCSRVKPSGFRLLHLWGHRRVEWALKRVCAPCSRWPQDGEPNGPSAHERVNRMRPSQGTGYTAATWGDIVTHYRAR